MSSIFGIEAPKFEYDSSVLELDYVKYGAEDFDYGVITHESVINRYREFTEKGDHFVFKITVNLFKYDDPNTKYYKIADFKNKLGYLWKRRDGDPFHNEFGNPVLFRFSKMQESWLNIPGFPDVLLLEFISQDPIDLRQTVAASGIGTTVNPTVVIDTFGNIVYPSPAIAQGETIDPNISIANGSYTPDPANAEGVTVDPTVIIEAV